VSDDVQDDIDHAAESQAHLEQRRRYEEDVWSAKRAPIAADLFTTPLKWPVYDRTYKRWEGM
jgi:hypothetical protein